MLAHSACDSLDLLSLQEECNAMEKKVFMVQNPGELFKYSEDGGIEALRQLLWHAPGIPFQFFSFS